MTDKSPDLTSTQKFFEWLGIIGLNIAFFVAGIGIGSVVLTRFPVNYHTSISASSTSTSYEERAHMGFLDQIQGCESVKGRILWAYVKDQAGYFRNEPQQCRLIALEELLHPDHIEAYKSQYKKRITQPFVNLFLATTYLSWWHPTFQLNIVSDQLIQRFLCKAGLMVHDLSFNLENCVTIERPLIETFYFFNRLCCIYEAIFILRIKLNTKKFKFVSDQQQEKFIYDCLKEGFQKYYKDNMVPFEEKEQQVENYLQAYFYVH